MKISMAKVWVTAVSPLDGWRTALGAVLLVLAGLSLFAGPVSAQAAKKPVHLKVGAIGALTDAGIFIALEKGYFRAEGIEIEIVRFNAGPQIVPALAKNQVQATGLAVGPGLFNAMNRGIDMRIVADKGQVNRKSRWATIAVRKDLAAKIKDFKDLKGLKIAVPAKGVTTYTELGKALELGSLTPKDVNIVELSFPNMIVAFTNKAIDAATLIEPFVTLALVKKAAVRFKEIGAYYPITGQNGVVAYSEAFRRDQPEAAKRWMVAYLRGVRDYNAAMETGKDRQQIVGILAKHTRVKNKKLYGKMAPVTLDPNGRFETRSFAADQAWFMKLGMQKRRVPDSKLFDTQYIDYAVTKLGRR